VPIFRADYLFRAVYLEPGSHRISFEYQPVWFYIGAAVNFIAFIFVAGFFILMNNSVYLPVWNPVKKCVLQSSNYFL